MTMRLIVWSGVIALLLGLRIGFAPDKVAVGANSNGGTDVGGLITSDTTWVADGSPYRVVSSVLIQSGVTLTIEPGVEIKFNPLLALQVNGGLIARGTSEAPIRFTSNAVTPAPGDWGFILFTDSSIDATYDGADDYMAGSILEHCAVEYAGSGTVFLTGSLESPPPAIHISQASPRINECAITKNKGSGIGVQTGSPKITHNDITLNGPSIRGGGIYLSNSYASGLAAITGNTIVDNVATEWGGGIYVVNSLVTIEGNVISGNSVTGQCCGGGGIMVSKLNQDVVIIGNVIEGNSAYGGGGIWLLNGLGGGIASIKGNEIIGNTASQSGGGIFLSQSGGPTVVSFNTIEGNTADDHGSAVYVLGRSVDVFGNHIRGNLSPRSALWVLKSNSVNITGNNIYQTNTGYLLYNATPNADPNVNAVNNWWGTAVEAEIRFRIYDWFEDLTVGIVDFVPFSLEPFSDSPPSPPTNLTAVGSEEAGGIVLSWSANSELDIAGYRVYYDTDAPGAPYQGTGANQGASPIDVGNVTSYSLTGLDSATTYYLSASAYDVNGNQSAQAADVQTSPTLPTPTPVPLEGLIAFSSAMDGISTEVYVMTADGTSQTKLTNDPAPDSLPAFSPDGSRIAFWSTRDGNGEIYVMNTDGSDQTNLTNNAADDQYPDWSPDGAKIVFESNRDGIYQIYIMNADGSGQTRITTHVEDDIQPAWSPDGSKIVFVRGTNSHNRELHVIDIDGANQTQLTDNSSADFQPDWSPDGNKIAFVFEENGNYDIYVINADGTFRTKLSNDQSTGFRADFSPVWSPSGNMIAYASNGEVYVMNANGSDRRSVTSNSGGGSNPSWTAEPQSVSTPTATPIPTPAPVPTASPTPVPGTGLLGLIGLALAFLLLFALRQRSIQSP